MLRAIKSGRISGTRDALGAWHVEPAELHRVFPPKAVEAGQSGKPRPPTPPCRSAQKPKRENSADLGCVDSPGFFSMASAGT